MPFSPCGALDLHQCADAGATVRAMQPRDRKMRIAIFNLESLDLSPKARVPLELRAKILRPALQRLQADVLCLQGGQWPAPTGARRGAIG